MAKLKQVEFKLFENEELPFPDKLKTKYKLECGTILLHNLDKTNFKDLKQNDTICNLARLLSEDDIGGVVNDRDIFTRAKIVFKIFSLIDNKNNFLDEINDINGSYNPIKKNDYDYSKTFLADTKFYNFLPSRELYDYNYILDKVFTETHNVYDIVYLLLRGPRLKLYYKNSEIIKTIHDEYKLLEKSINGNNFTYTAGTANTKTQDITYSTHRKSFIKTWRPLLLLGGNTLTIPPEFEKLLLQYPSREVDTEEYNKIISDAFKRSQELSRTSSSRPGSALSSPTGSPRQSSTELQTPQTPEVSDLVPKSPPQAAVPPSAVSTAAPAAAQHPPLAPPRSPAPPPRPPADQPLSRAQSVRPSQSIIKYSETLKDTSKELQKNKEKPDIPAIRFTVKSGNIANQSTRDSYSIKYFKIPDYRPESIFIYFTDNYTKYDNTTTPKGLSTIDPIPDINTLTPNTTILSECLSKPCRYIEHQLPTDGTYYTYLLNDAKKEIVEITIEKISRSTKDICDEIADNAKRQLPNFNHEEICKELDKFYNFAEYKDKDLLLEFNRVKNNDGELDKLLAYICYLMLQLWTNCITFGKNLEDYYDKGGVTLQPIPGISIHTDSINFPEFYEKPESYEVNQQVVNFNNYGLGIGNNVKGELTKIHTQLSSIFDMNKQGTEEFQKFMGRISTDQICDIFNDQKKYEYFCKLFGKLKDRKSLLEEHIEGTSDKSTVTEFLASRIAELDPVYKLYAKIFRDFYTVLIKEYTSLINNKENFDRAKSLVLTKFGNKDTIINNLNSLAKLYKEMNIITSSQLTSNITFESFKNLLIKIGKTDQYTFDDYIGAHKITDMRDEYIKLFNAYNAIKEDLFRIPRIYIKIGGAPVQDDENKATIIIGQCTDTTNLLEIVKNDDNHPTGVICKQVKQRGGAPFVSKKFKGKNKEDLKELFDNSQIIIVKDETKTIDTTKLELDKSKYYGLQKGISYLDLFVQQHDNAYIYEKFKVLFDSMKLINNSSYMIFAYGYSGTGKSHLLLNSLGDKGLIFKIIEDDLIYDYEIIDAKEIYIDSKSINISVNTDYDKKPHINGYSIRRFTIIDKKNVENLLKSIETERINGGIINYKTIRWTPNNPNSSRSHLLIRLKITFKEQKDKEGNIVKNNAYITIIDMGGSEDGDYIVNNITADTSGSTNYIYTSNNANSANSFVNKSLNKRSLEKSEESVSKFGNFVVRNTNYSDEYVKSYIIKFYNDQTFIPSDELIFNEYIPTEEKDKTDRYHIFLYSFNDFRRNSDNREKIIKFINNCNLDINVNQLYQKLSGNINGFDNLVKTYKVFRAILYLNYQNKEIVYDFNGDKMRLDLIQRFNYYSAENNSYTQLDQQAGLSSTYNPGSLNDKSFYSYNKDMNNKLLTNIIFPDQYSTPTTDIGYDIKDLVRDYIYQLCIEGFFINDTLDIVKKIYNKDKEVSDLDNINSTNQKIKKFIDFLFDSNDSTFAKEDSKTNRNETKLILFGNIREDKVKVDDSINTLKFLYSLTHKEPRSSPPIFRPSSAMPN